MIQFGLKITAEFLANLNVAKFFDVTFNISNGIISIDHLLSRDRALLDIETRLIQQKHYNLLFPLERELPGFHSRFNVSHKLSDIFSLMVR